MVISTGTIRPSLACACVAALNSLQNPMMLTPCWPSAGPTGGDGFAFPAGSCSFTIPVTFFAIASLSRGSSGLERTASHRDHVFSTCMKSSSTGVARPKIETSTRTRPLSGFTSSTVPLKFENGPSTTRTLSPSSNSTFGFGFSAPSESCVVSRAISCSLTAGGLVALPTNPVILGVFFTRCQVRSFSSICTRMYPGKNLRFEARFSPFTISTTFSIGMRMSPKYSSREFCLIFSSSDFFALFSKPEYVWTTYHFLSIFFSSAAIGILLSDARVLDLVRQELPEHVEEAQQHGGDDGSDDHGDGGGAGLGKARPAHLAQLAGDLQRHLVRPGVHPQVDGGGAAALPLELLACGARLLRLLVLGVLAATGAELRQEQLVRHGPLVLRRGVVALLAHRALERDDGSVHLFAPSLEPTTRIELVTSSLPRKCSAD